MAEGQPQTQPAQPQEDRLTRTMAAYHKAYEPVEKWFLKAGEEFFDLPATIVEKAPEKIIHGSIYLLAPIVMLLAGTKDYLKKGFQFLLDYFGGKEFVDAHKQGRDAIRWALGYGALPEKK